MVVAIYSRKSKFTGKGDSIENQVQMCKEYAKENLQVTKFIVYEDEGFTGSNTRRPNFQQLLKDVKARKFDVVICYRLDRISRNVPDFSSTLKLLQNNNIDFISIKEQFDTSTPMGKAMIYIASVFAELERDTIAERIQDNMLELAKSGRWLGGQTPLGFNSEKIIYMDEEYKQRAMYRLSPIDNELNLVKFIYEKYLEFKSLRKVTQYLLENNIKTKMGADWNVRAVSDLLKNPTYVMANKKVFDYLKSLGIMCIGNPDGKHGILTYNKKKGQKQYREKKEWISAIAKHEGVIEADKWLKVQKTLKFNKKNPSNYGRTNTTLLTGLIRCAKCGSPMTVIHGSKDNEGNKIYYYACSMKVNSKGTRCSNKNIRSDEIEDIVINKLKNISKDKELLLKELKSIKRQATFTKSYSTELKLMNTYLKSNEKSIENLVKQLSQNPNSIAGKYIIAEIEKKEIEVEKIKSKITNLKEKKLKSVEISFNIDLIVNNLKNLYDTINKDDIEKKKYLISSLVDKITWDGTTGNVDINLWGS